MYLFGHIHVHMYVYVCSECSNCYSYIIFLFYEACANDSSGGLFWINSRKNLLVTQPCSELHPNFRSGVEIGRQCNSDSNWSPVDITNCTMFLKSNPVIIVYFTVAVSDSNAIDSATIINNVSFYSYVISIQYVAN